MSLLSQGPIISEPMCAELLKNNQERERVLPWRTNEGHDIDVMLGLSAW